MREFASINLTSIYNYTAEVVQYCVAMFACLALFHYSHLKSQDHLLVSSIPAYTGESETYVNASSTTLAAASAKVSAEKKVKRGSTLVTVINFTTANSDWFPLLNKISNRLPYSGIFLPSLFVCKYVVIVATSPCEKSTVSSERKRRKVKKIGRVQTFSEFYIFNLLGLIIVIIISISEV